MQDLLELPSKERSLFFQEAAFRSPNIKNPIIIEKDFWVCWVLNQIFSNDALSPHIIFKGGTSLSKCYNMIERFSEDIDLTLSKEYIGLNENNDPANVSSNKQRDKRLNDFSNKVKSKIALEVKPLLIEGLKKNLANYFQAHEWSLVPDENDEQSLIFHYPTTLERKADEIYSICY